MSDWQYCKTPSTPYDILAQTVDGTDADGIEGKPSKEQQQPLSAETSQRQVSVLQNIGMETVTKTLEDAEAEAQALVQVVSSLQLYAETKLSVCVSALLSSMCGLSTTQHNLFC